MFDSIQWVKGDRSNLVGRVLAYGVNIDSSDHLEYPALIGALNIEGIIKIKKEDVGPMDAESIKKNFDDVRARLKESIDENKIPGVEIPDLKINPIIPVFVSNLGFDIQKYDCDVIKGKILSPTHANTLLMGAVHLYLATYELQLAKKIKVKDEKYVSEMPAFKNVEKEDFKKHMGRLVSNLMYTMEYQGNTDNIFTDMKKLTQGSAFIQDVHNFYNLASTEHPNKIKLMELYLHKMFAILDENYEKVLRIIEKIGELDEKGD